MAKYTPCLLSLAYKFLSRNAYDRNEEETMGKKKKIIQRVFKNFVTGLRAMGRQILFEQGCGRSRQYLQFTNGFGWCGEKIPGIQGVCLHPNDQRKLCL